jgi:hypothetical protein
MTERKARLRHVLWAGSLVTVLLVAAVVAWQWRHPDRSFDAGYGIELERAVGVRLWTVLEHGQTATPGTIEIRDIEPHVTRDQASLEVEYVICHLDADAIESGTTSVGYGMPDEVMSSVCVEVESAEGATMRLGEGAGQELLVGVTATRPGRSVIDTHRIRFGEGWQQGAAAIHVGVNLTARPAKRTD